MTLNRRGRTHNRVLQAILANAPTQHSSIWASAQANLITKGVRSERSAPEGHPRKDTNVQLKWEKRMYAGSTKSSPERTTWALRHFLQVCPKQKQGFKLTEQLCCLVSIIVTAKVVREIN